MRRAIACAAATAALVLPAGAHAASLYTGSVKGDEKAPVELKVSGKGDARVVRSFSVEQLRIKCESGVRARLGGASLSGRAAVSDEGRFALKGTEGEVAVVLKGKLRGKKRATGTIRYFGPTTVDGETLDCASGKVRWRASR